MRARCRVSRLLVALTGLVAATLVVAPAASADGHGLGGAESGGDEVVFNASNRIEYTITATRGATRETVEIREEDRPCAEEGVTSVTAIEDDDGNPVLDEDGNQVFSENIGCVLRYYCGAERIDDVYSGAVSGPESGGVYEDYIGVLTELVAALINVFGGPGEVPDDLGESISETVIEIGLGDPVSNDQLPVFYYCLRGDGGPLELFDDDYDPQFAWDTEISDEYDIVTDTVVILDALEERLRGNVPELRAIPPLDQGRTFVKFPMWFCLDDPVELDGVWAISDIGTIRIEARASLREVEWSWGEGDPLTCDLDEMRPWIQGTDPTKNVPPCSHAFTELQEFELTATAVYDVEQRISYRLSAVGTPWPNTPWTTAAMPEVRVTGSAGVIDVRQLLSLNVNEELDFGEPVSPSLHPCTPRISGVLAPPCGADAPEIVEVLALLDSREFGRQHVAPRLPSLAIASPYHDRDRRSRWTASHVIWQRTMASSRTPKPSGSDSRGAPSRGWSLEASGFRSTPAFTGSPVRLRRGSVTPEPQPRRRVAC